MDTKTFLLVYSDNEITEVQRASLNNDEFQTMLTLRIKLKEKGASFMVLEEGTQAVLDGQEALTKNGRTLRQNTRG